MVGNTKICKKCYLEKSTNDFYKHKAQCKACYHIKNTTYYSINKEDVLKTNKEYYHDNKETILRQKKDFFLSNKDTIIENQKLYRARNSDRIRSVKRFYRIKNKSSRSIQLKNRYHYDEGYRLRVILSSSIFKALKKVGSSKGGESSIKNLPYSIQEFRGHLEKQFEPWMNWNNHGKYNMDIWDDSNPLTWTWHIDHIIPQSKLPYTTMLDDNFKKCWALDNLRPLSAKQNISDGNKR